uniref:Uncharacterized protein n=1 Tax=Cacopsylla melanoneura TaxID=428564 RepID=A0A8D8R5Y0_9HEMI
MPCVYPRDISRANVIFGFNLIKSFMCWWLALHSFTITVSRRWPCIVSPRVDVTPPNLWPCDKLFLLHTGPHLVSLPISPIHLASLTLHTNAPSGLPDALTTTLLRPSKRNIQYFIPQVLTQSFTYFLSPSYSSFLLSLSLFLPSRPFCVLLILNYNNNNNKKVNVWKILNELNDKFSKSF